jgi:uncharacterized protein
LIVGQLARLGRLAAGAGFALVLLLPPHPSLALSTSTLTLKTQSGPHPFTVEVATTDQERALGLMFRRNLAADAGMLFLYDRPQPLSMWMRNTYLSLDMIFIGADGRVQHIESRTEPFSTALISSEGAVRGVLEVNAGTAETIGLRAGDEVIYPGLGPTQP